MIIATFDLSTELGVSGKLDAPVLSMPCGMRKA
jgi:hypothetical protein